MRIINYLSHLCGFVISQHFSSPSRMNNVRTCMFVVIKYNVGCVILVQEMCVEG